jgi:hypothetical protein
MWIIMIIIVWILVEVLEGIKIAFMVFTRVLTKKVGEQIDLFIFLVFLRLILLLPFKTETRMYI